MPEVAIIDEVIVFLNPIYGSFIESAERLLFRMGFKTLQHRLITLDEQIATQLFSERMNQPANSVSFQNVSNSSTTSSGEKIAKYLAGAQIYMWHLTKISGDREIR